MSVTAQDALKGIPSGLRSDLLDAFDEILRNYRELRWGPSELNGGKLCEAAYTIVDGFLNGSTFPSRAKKPRNFLQACLDLESKYAHVPNSRSPRILIPRMMIGIYDIRNNRGVGHAGGDVDPNEMDATVVLYTSKWLVAEIIRLLHTVTTSEASELVERLVEREVPLVWSNGDVKRVLRTDLSWKEQTMILLLANDGPVAEGELFGWLEHSNLSNFRGNVLRPMHAARLIEYDEDTRKVSILPPGVRAAESLVTQV